MAHEFGEFVQAVVVDVKSMSKDSESALRGQKERLTIMPTSVGVPGSTVQTGT